MFETMDEFIDLAKELYWDTDEMANMYTYDGGRYILLDKWINADGTTEELTITMTKGGTDSWWVETDDLCIGTLANNAGYGWKHPEIAEGMVVCGGYAGIVKYAVDANGNITCKDVSGEVIGGAWNGVTHKVAVVYDTDTVLFTIFDLGVVEAE